jgi:hypothetical protein
VQTHISYLFLTGDVIYKTKKPVDFGFIDQVAPERREAFCHTELHLNRRLAPDVYLGVVPIVRLTDGRIAGREALRCAPPTRRGRSTAPSASASRRSAQARDRTWSWTRRPLRARSREQSPRCWSRPRTGPDGLGC